MIFNPTLQLGVFLVNSTIPPANSPFQCAGDHHHGLDLRHIADQRRHLPDSTFGDTVNSFITYNNQVVGAENTNGTGSTSVVLAGGHSFLVMQTSSPGSSGGTGGRQQRRQQRRHSSGRRCGDAVQWPESAQQPCDLGRETLTRQQALTHETQTYSHARTAVIGLHA